MKTIAICDDNRAHLERALQLLRQHIVGPDEDVQIELFEEIDDCVAESGRFDVVFMDIEFDDDPRGIEAVERINEVSPSCQVVYLTNYLHYSLDVYGTDHVWYVLKSQFDQRLPEILHKLRAIERRRRETIAIRPVGETGFITLMTNDVCYLERSYRSTRLVMRDGTRYEVRDKISDLLSKLPEGVFARCHNSYAVNFECLKRVRSTELDLEGGHLVPVSRQYSKPFRAKYLTWIEEWTV